MKKIIFLFSFAMLLILNSCSNAKNDKNENGENAKDKTSGTEKSKQNDSGLGKFPFDFPVIEDLNASKGDNVFAVNMKLVNNAIKEGKTTFGTQYLFAHVEEVAKKESKIKFVDICAVPNSGIVVIPKGQNVKVGDIVAGKWAVNLTRAIITDASNPKAPKASFIGIDWDNPAKAEDRKTGIGQFEYTLKENEFMIISKDFDPGSACAVKDNGKWKHMNVFNSVGDMVMGTIFVNFTAVKKSDCVAIPLKTNYKVGDSVWAPWVGTMSKGKITNVNTKMGRYTIKFDESNKGEKVLAFGDVIKDLPNLK
jgi:hypothetical protein